MSFPVRLALIFVIALLGFGLWLSYGPRTAAAARAELLDGDADRAERLRCLEIVREDAMARARAGGVGDVGAAVLAAMASIDLGDRAGYDEALRLAGGRSPWLPGVDPDAGTDPGGGSLDELALGEPYLRQLLQGHAAENRGAREAARDLYRRTERCARLFGAELAAELAVEGRGRVGE